MPGGSVVPAHAVRRAMYVARVRIIVAALLMPLALAGCAEKKPAPEPSDIVKSGMAQIRDAMPKCSDVWQVGKKLPAKYDGCKDSTGAINVVVEQCDGITTYETPGHGYYSDAKRVIHDGGENYADTPEYQAVTAHC